MATTDFPRATAADLRRVEESLAMLAPRWSVWTLMSLETEPLRYTKIKDKLPWLKDAQMSARLQQLSADGLIGRHEHHFRHVTYDLADRGRNLRGVLDALVAWADTHLEKEALDNGKPEPVARAQEAEDALGLITPRHATPVLWALKARGSARAHELATALIPTYRKNSIYPPLRQLMDVALIEREPSGLLYRLTPAGHALAPVYSAISAWAAGRPATTSHPLWARAPAPPAAKDRTWTTNASRVTAERQPTAAPATDHRPPAVNAQSAHTAAWRSNDLFSHALPPRPTVAPALGGRAR